MTKHYRYFFNKGYGLVPTEKTKAVREQLINAINPCSRTPFYTALRDGLLDIKLPVYERITEILVQAGIPEKDIWRRETWNRHGKGTGIKKLEC